MPATPLTRHAVPTTTREQRVDVTRLVGQSVAAAGVAAADDTAVV